MQEIFKVHKNLEYITVNIHYLMDKTLSLKAKGLLTILLALPKDRECSINSLTELSDDGKTAVRTALQELEKHNYLFREKIYVKNLVAGVQYHVFEIPTDEETFRRLDFLTLENLTLENKPNPINTNIDNKEHIKEPIQDIKGIKVYTGKKQKKSLIDSKDTVQEIIDYYQKNCPDLKHLRVVTDSRKTSVRVILKKYGPDTVKEVLDKAQASSFLKGETGTWKCGFDWIFTEKNFIKILEGNYDKSFTKKQRLYDEGVSTDTYTEQEKENIKEMHKKLRREGKKVEY